MEIIKAIGFLAVMYIIIYLKYLLAFVGLIFLIRGLYLKIKNKDSEKAFNTSSNFFTMAIFTFVFIPILINIIVYISAR